MKTILGIIFAPFVIMFAFDRALDKDKDLRKYKRKRRRRGRRRW